jgi:hypothetical protein
MTTFLARQREHMHAGYAADILATDLDYKEKVDPFAPDSCHQGSPFVPVTRSP